MSLIETSKKLKKWIVKNNSYAYYFDINRHNNNYYGNYLLKIVLIDEELYCTYNSFSLLENLNVNSLIDYKETTFPFSMITETSKIDQIINKSKIMTKDEARKFLESIILMKEII